MISEALKTQFLTEGDAISVRMRVYIALEVVEQLLEQAQQPNAEVQDARADRSGKRKGSDEQQADLAGG